MAYGIQSLNSSSSILIDQNYTNLYLKEEGTLAFSGATAEDFAEIGPPFNLTREDLLFVQCDTAGIYLYKRANSTASSTKLGAIGPAGTVRYRIYGRTDSNVLPAGTGYGLEVYNAAEDLVFSSNLKVPRITKRYYGQMPIIDSLDSVVGNVWACVAGTEWFRVRSSPDFYDYQCVECYKTGTTSYFRPLMQSASVSNSLFAGSNPNLVNILFIQD